MLYIPVLAAGETTTVDGMHVERDIYYRTDAEPTDYTRERCRLDLAYPVDKQNYATVVWFHGGGLTGGNKSFPKQLLNKGIAVVAANYRLSPHVKSPVYIEDAAAAVAWTFRNIEKYGGRKDRIVVSGHSAGGYLTSMVGLDKQYLAAHDIDADEIAGLVPYSGHTITHFTIRSERGLKQDQPVVDEFAPLFHIRKDAPPILLITGDRELELLARYEENAYMWRMLQTIGHSHAKLYELEGFNHGEMAEPAHPLLLRFIKELN